MKRIWLIFTLFAVLAGNLSAGQTEASVFLWKDGKSGYRIILPSKYENQGIRLYLHQAAERLQSAIKEASGVVMPIAEEDSLDAKTPAIFIGNTLEAQRQGIIPASLPDFSYLIAVRNGNVFLCGNDRHGFGSRKSESYVQYILGSVKAVVVFMENYLGTRFLYPGEVGTSTPRSAGLSVPEGLSQKRTPMLNYAAGRNYELMYDYANNNFGKGAYWSYGGHSYYSAVPVRKYGKTHPEYFIMQGGKRDITHGHLCISNPAVQELIYREMLRRLDGGAEVVQLAQTDGYITCECDECRKFGNTDDPAEKLWILHRQLAEKLKQDRPGKKVMIIAYAPTWEPPRTFQEFPGNVIIELCRYDRKTFEQWSKIKGICGFTAYVYNWGEYPMPGITAKRTPAFCARQIRLFAANRIRGIYRCGFGEAMGMEGPAYYVYGKLLDDPLQKPETLADEFYRSAFQEAAVPMQIFYRQLFERLEAFSVQEENHALPGSNPRVLLGAVYAPDALEIMEKNLTLAENLAVSPKVKKRLELVRREFDYTRNLAVCIHLYNAYRLMPDWHSFNRLGEWIEARNRMLNSWYDTENRMKPVPGWPEIRFMGNVSRGMALNNGRLIAQLGAPFTWNIKMLRDKKILPGAKRKQLTVKKAAGPITAADFTQGAWSQAQWHELNNIQLGTISEKTSFKVIYDSENIYFGIVTELPEQRKVRGVGQDGEAYCQDCIEIFLDPFGFREKFFHFVYNPVPGSRYDAVFGMIEDPLHPLYKREDISWNGQWEIISKREKNLWTSFVRIPFRELGVRTPGSGDRWNFNLGRQAFLSASMKWNGELSLWSPNLETMRMDSPDAFGEAVFE